MANYTHDGPRRLLEAGQRSYGALKSALQRSGTPTNQHNVNVTKSKPKATKKSVAKPVKKAAAKKTASKPVAKTTTKKTTAKSSSK